MPRCASAGAYGINGGLIHTCSNCWRPNAVSSGISNCNSPMPGCASNSSVKALRGQPPPCNSRSSAANPVVWQRTSLDKNRRSRLRQISGRCNSCCKVGFMVAPILYINTVYWPRLKMQGSPSLLQCRPSAIRSILKLPNARISCAAFVACPQKINKPWPESWANYTTNSTANLFRRGVEWLRCEVKQELVVWRLGVSIFYSFIVSDKFLAAW